LCIVDNLILDDFQFNYQMKLIVLEFFGFLLPT
jgi:hypothetical protein